MGDRRWEIGDRRTADGGRRLGFTKPESPASLDQLAKSSRPPAVKFAPCEPQRSPVRVEADLFSRKLMREGRRTTFSDDLA